MTIAARTPRLLTPLAIALLAASAVVIGCSSSDKGAADATGAHAKPNAKQGAGDPLDDETQRRLKLMEQALANADRTDQAFQFDDPPASSGQAKTDYWKPVEVGEGGTTGPVNPVEADGVASRPATSAPAPDPKPSLTREQQVRRHVGELAALVRDDARDLGFMLPAWIRIAALDTIEPGTLNSYFIQGSSGDSALSEPEHQFLNAWRDLHTAIWENAGSADVAHLASLVQNAAQRMSSLRPLEIADAVLCTKVERYGVYTERKSYDGVNKLLAGKAQRLLVYIELENYAHKDTTENGVDGYSVDLTVGLSLHHLGQGADLLAWRMADERVSVFSRNHRREFFLTIVADLPETISVDSYTLKAHVTDENSGAVAEKLIRIDVVADASAFRGR